MTNHRTLESEVEKLKKAYNDVKTYTYSTAEKKALHQVRNSIRDLAFSCDILLLVYKFTSYAQEESLKSVLDEDLANITSHRGDIPLPDIHVEEQLFITWLERYAVAIKSFFYFTRAYQDTLCRLVLESNGQKLSDRTTMSAILPDCSTNHPMGKIVYEKIPEYQRWFEDFRIKRNYIKGGGRVGASSVALTGGTFDGQLHFLRAPKDKASVSLQYIVDAVSISTRLTKIVFEDEVVLSKISSIDSSIPDAV